MHRTPFSPLRWSPGSPTSPSVAANPTAAAPARKFRKEIARVGSYAHPDGELEFTPERLASWVASFEAAKAAGVELPVPLGHDPDPAANAGWVESLELSPEGDKLYAVLVITRPDVAALVENGTIRHTSLALGPLADDSGNFWEEAILEISLVNDPHVRRQEPFVLLAGARELAIALAAARKESTVEKPAESVIPETTAVSAMEAKLDGLIAAGLLPAELREDVLSLLTLLPDEATRLKLLETYRRRGVKLGASTRPVAARTFDPEVEQVARRFGLPPEELAHYLAARCAAPQIHG